MPDTAADFVSVEQALARLADSVPVNRPAIESCAISVAAGRVLAEIPSARTDAPPFDTSAMDGFAINVADCSAGERLKISQRVTAGSVAGPLQAGTVARIFTGAPIPAGADCVIMQENGTYDEDSVTFHQLAPAGNNIRERGKDVSSGAPLFTVGHQIRAQDIGLLITAGVSQVKVYAPLKVAIIATGDELTDIDDALQPGRIFDSNSVMLAALVTQMGCLASRYRAADTLEATIDTLSRATQNNDVVLTIGGVSVGDEDHVKAALQNLGQCRFWKIKVKPGKPFLFGVANDTPVMGLPGNPVSSYVTFLIFCRPFINCMRGSNFSSPITWPAVARFEFTKTSNRQQYLRGNIQQSDGQVSVTLQARQGSGMQQALCEADVLIVVPPEHTIRRDQTVTVIPLSQFS